MFFFSEKYFKFFLILPEICITILSFFILFFGVFIVKNRKSLFYTICIVCSLIVFCVCIFILLKVLRISVNGYQILHGHRFVLDYVAVYQKIAMFFFSFLCLIFIQKYLKHFNLISTEFLSLFLFSILGSSIVISSGDFLLLYIGIELSAFPIYTLIAMNGVYKMSYEAALKYFIMGCVSSAFLLFGISLIYGLSGTLNFYNNEIYFSNSRDSFICNGIFYFGPTFIIAGLCFKFGAAPFHMWVPDVYRGTTSAIVMIIGTIPKIAAYAVMCRLLNVIFAVDYSLYACSYMISFVALISLFIGNFGALNQTNVKRLLGYSAISNIGFLFFGFIAGMNLSSIYLEGDGFFSSFFYLYVYLLSFSGFVFVLNILSVCFNKEIELIVEFRGLFYRYPSLSIFLLIFLFSLIGFPPFVGFYAKFFILLQLFYYGLGDVVVFILLFSVIGAYYYLKIVKEIFFYSKSTMILKFEKNEKCFYGFGEKIFLTFLSFVILISGIFPGILIRICFP